MQKIFLAAAVAIGLVAQAHAASLSALDMLQQFNVVVLNNDTSTSHVDGRTYVGGNLTGGNYAQHPATTPASAYSGLTVKGSASNVTVNSLGASIGGNLSNSTVNSGPATVAGNASSVNFNGIAAVGGTTSGVNFNGGTYANPATAIANAQAVANSTDFASTMQSTSDQLKSLASTGSSVTLSGNTATFNATVTNGVAVFDLTGSENDIFSAGEFAFNLNGASSVVINTDVSNVSIAANFLANSAVDLASSIIWNFWNATSITINSQFGGSILAPQATLTNNQNIEGGVYVNTLYQNGEIHQNAYTGNLPSPVPLPGSMGLMLSALAALGALRYRKG